MEKLVRARKPVCLRCPVCRLIEKSSVLRLLSHGDDVVLTWQQLIDDCLQHNEADVQVSKNTCCCKQAADNVSQLVFTVSS